MSNPDWDSGRLFPAKLKEMSWKALSVGRRKVEGRPGRQESWALLIFRGLRKNPVLECLASVNRVSMSLLICISRSQKTVPEFRKKSKTSLWNPNTRFWFPKKLIPCYLRFTTIFSKIKRNLTKCLIQTRFHVTTLLKSFDIWTILPKGTSTFLKITTLLKIWGLKWSTGWLKSWVHIKCQKNVFSRQFNSWISTWKDVWEDKSLKTFIWLDLFVCSLPRSKKKSTQWDFQLFAIKSQGKSLPKRRS